MKKIIAKVKLINKEVRKLKFITNSKEQAIQVEKVNSMITGITAIS